MTTQLKHSPAPWYWDDEDAMPWTDYDETIHAPFLMDANGRAVMSGDDIRIRNEADGVLIAKAGEMADEIERLTHEKTELLESLKTMCSLMTNGCVEFARLPFTWREAFDEAESAIAKAEGRDA